MISGKVCINGRNSDIRPNGELKLNLLNGHLVIHYNKSKEVMGTYLVTSFRDSKGKYGGDSTTPYCTLIDLSTGYPKFEERCSRNTTMERVLSHLSPGDYRGEYALKQGQYLEVYNRRNYEVNLNFNVENNEGWRTDHE